MRRRFNLHEKIALFEEANGRCLQCRKPLGTDWHGDHIKAFSRGGPTAIENGRALCSSCNLKKGDAQVRELRKWQVRAVALAREKFREGKQVFAAGVSVGGGKTIMGCVLAEAMVSSGLIDRVIVVAPNQSIKNGWAEDMTDVGLRVRNLDGNDAMRWDIPDGDHGYITTYQSVDAQPQAHRKRCLALTVASGGRCRTLVIFDELHHLGDDECSGGNATKWASSCKQAFGDATYIVCLTGTPGRCDGLRLPFIEYDGPNESGESKARLDIVYSYGKAVDDQIVRRCEFIPIEASGDVSGDVSGRASTRDKKSPLRAAVERAALNLSAEPSQGFEGLAAEDMLDLALTQLDIRRATHPRAAMIAVCDNIKHAQYIEQCLRARGETPVLVTSDTPDAHQKIKRFRSSNERVIVAVAMISEGVNIPRLRVCAYMSRKTAPLTLEQIMGRVVRIDWRDRKNQNGEEASFDDVGMQHPPGEAAFLYLNKPEIVSWVREVEREMEAVVREREDRERRDRMEILDPVVPDIRVDELSVRNDGLTIGGAEYSQDVASVLYDFRKGNPTAVLPTTIAAKIIDLAIRRSQSVRHETAAVERPEQSYDEKLRDLTIRCDRAVRRIGARNRWEREQFAKLHHWANQKAGIESQKAASPEQLERKLQALAVYEGEPVA